jgi:hypothetical protein
MLAAKCGQAATTRVILNFGIDPATILLKDADGSTPLHVAVQSANTTLAAVLLDYGPAELLYSENSVGQTPLDIAGLKCLPRVTRFTEVRRPNVLTTNPEQELYSLQSTAPFDVEKQRIVIPKLRATLDMLFADGRLVHGTKLATELLTFAAHMEGKLAIEVARMHAAKQDTEEAGVDPVVSQGTTARTYAVLREAAAAHSGSRRLAHLADVQRSVQRNLAQQADKTPVSWGLRMQESSERSKEVDPEEQRIRQLKARSLLATEPTNQLRRSRPVDLFDEDKM